jgi:phosphatidylserine/phosphatidylglycerophosphate/cardiolipin synthase-like enzyme
MKVFNIASKSYACTSGKDIQTGILNELHGAQSSIFAAVAWFTDQDLLDMLLAKTALGLDVKLVIADNEENQKLNFESLIDAGAELKRVKGNGFGMMHQKY